MADKLIRTVVVTEAGGLKLQYCSLDKAAVLRKSKWKIFFEEVEKYIYLSRNIQ
jgi:hypothetical protein